MTAFPVAIATLRRYTPANKVLDAFPSVMVFFCVRQTSQLLHKMKCLMSACGFVDVYSVTARLRLSVVSSVGGHGVADPAVVVADLDVDTGLVLLGAAYTPGHHTLQLTVAHHGATRVHLVGHRRTSALK